MIKAERYFFIILGLVLAYVGIHEFNTAKNSVQLFKGLFWMAVGMFNIWSRL